MKTRVAINGFGRIGRMVFRNAILNDEIEVVAVNASYAPEILKHLIKYDTTHGRFNGTVEASDKELIVNGKIVKLTNSRDPKLLPWKEMGIDIVIEATGKFNNKEKAIGHIEAGAKKVLITAPATNEDITIVMGVNEELFDVENHHIVSNASCTTNCLAPLAKVLDQNFGIENGLMTTVHGYTNDQNNIDNPHKDLRRARACAQNIIPTSTGAAKALSLVLPQLKGKIHGMCLRVPTVNVSLVDLVVDLKRPVTVEEVNAALTEAANGPMKGILDITMEPLVSTDFMTDSHSSIIDGLSTMMIGDRKIKVLSWYDNEWGYSNRVVDLALYMGKKMVENNKQTVMSN